MNLEIVKLFIGYKLVSSTTFCDFYAATDKSPEKPNMFIERDMERLICCWYLYGAELHRTDGPAKITRDLATGKVIREDYYLNNRWLSYSDWLAANI